MLFKKYKIVLGEKYTRVKIKTKGLPPCPECKYLMCANNRTRCNYYKLCLGIIRFSNMFSSYAYSPT